MSLLEMNEVFQSSDLFRGLLGYEPQPRPRSRNLLDRKMSVEGFSERTEEKDRTHRRKKEEKNRKEYIVFISSLYNYNQFISFLYKIT